MVTSALRSTPLSKEHLKDLAMHYGPVTKKAVLTEQLTVIGSHYQPGVLRHPVKKASKRTVDVFDTSNLLLPKLSEKRRRKSFMIGYLGGAALCQCAVETRNRRKIIV